MPGMGPQSPGGEEGKGRQGNPTLPQPTPAAKPPRPTPGDRPTTDGGIDDEQRSRDCKKIRDDLDEVTQKWASIKEKECPERKRLEKQMDDLLRDLRNKCMGARK
jgi:hypothetical protein